MCDWLGVTIALIDIFLGIEMQSQAFAARVGKRKLVIFAASNYVVFEFGVFLVIGFDLSEWRFVDYDIHIINTSLGAVFCDIMIKEAVAD